MRKCRAKVYKKTEDDHKVFINAWFHQWDTSSISADGVYGIVESRDGEDKGIMWHVPMRCIFFEHSPS